MKNSELRSLSITDLSDKLSASEKDLQRLKFAHAISPIENPMRIRDLRRHVASMKGILDEKVTADLMEKISEGTVTKENASSFMKEAEYPVLFTTSKIKKIFSKVG